MPYTSGAGKVETCPSKCADGSTFKRYKCKDDSVVVARTPNAIKTELFNNGPMDTHFTVYLDFMSYDSGIY